MLKSRKVTSLNPDPHAVDQKLLDVRYYNELKDDFDAINTDLGSSKADTISEYTSGAGVTVDGVLLKDNGISLGTTKVTEYCTEVTLTATEIVGTSAGDIGHSAGAIIVAAPTSDYALEFVSAVLVYDYSTAAYTGGNNDMVFRVGTTAVSTAITDTNCIKATGDKVFRLGAIATEVSLGVGSTINLFSTAFTQPGTAAGVLRVQVVYRIHTTSL